MASAQVVETSVTNNSPSQDCYHPDDLFQLRYTLTSLPMMPRPGTQALVVSRADKIYISALFASSLVRNNYGRARARPQTNLAFVGQRHFLKAYSARADLKQNVGTFLAFLCSSNWNEWYVNKRRSKGPGVKFKLRDMGHVFHVNISKCSFPKHTSRPAFTRPSNKIFIPFKERLLYGLISPSKLRVCFRLFKFII